MSEQTRIWLKAFVLCAVMTALTFIFVDVPVANFFHSLHWTKALRAPFFRVPLLIAGFGAAFFLIGIRSFKGRKLDSRAETIVLATLSLALTVCINEFVLKPLFARPTPHYFARTGYSFFGQMRDVSKSSFPSGHAAQLSALVMIAWSRYPAWRALCCIVFLISCLLMVLGGWHFVSDLVAGTFVGAFCAAIMMALWEFRTEVTSKPE